MRFISPDTLFHYRLVLPLTCFPTPTETIDLLHGGEDYYYLLLFLLVHQISAVGAGETGNACEYIMEILGEILCDTVETTLRADLPYPSSFSSQKEHQLFDEYLCAFDAFQARMFPYFNRFFMQTPFEHVELEGIEAHPYDPTALVVTLCLECQ